jgi:hypothetical protein
MGTEMGTVGVKDVQLPVIIAKRDEVLTEITKGTNLTGRELSRPADHEPARWLPGKRDLHVITAPLAG